MDDFSIMSLFLWYVAISIVIGILMVPAWILLDIAKRGFSEWKERSTEWEEPPH